MKTLVIIPAHNEEQSILKIVKEVQDWGYDYVVVNDASTDQTKEILVNNKINHVSHPINLGLSESIKTGFRYAVKMKYDCGVQIDGDGQHNPAYVAPMLKLMAAEHYNFIQGSRFQAHERKHFSLRMLGSSFISFVILVTTLQKVKDPTNGMRMFDRDLMIRFVNEGNLYVEPDTVAYLIKDKYRWTETYVEVRNRFGGRSYFTSFRAFLYMIEVVFSILFVQAFRPKRNKKQLKQAAKLAKKRSS